MGVQIQVKVRETGYEVDINGSCWASRVEVNPLSVKKHPEHDISSPPHSGGDDRRLATAGGRRRHGDTAARWPTNESGDDASIATSDMGSIENKNTNISKNRKGADTEPCFTTRPVARSPRVEGENQEGAGGKRHCQKREDDDDSDSKGGNSASKSDGRADAHSGRFERDRRRQRGRRRQSWQDYYSSEDDDRGQSWSKSRSISDEYEKELGDFKGFFGRDGWTRCHEENNSRSPSPGIS